VSTNIELIDNTIHEPGVVVNASAIFSQQLWCWGRDIVRAEGNWLIQSGFDGISAPPEKAGCKNIYTLSLSDSEQVLLRGFGVLYSDHRGTIFLPRSKFEPLFTNSTELKMQPWEISDLSDFNAPNGQDVETSYSLLRNLVDWIIKYEKGVQEALGVEYRTRTLKRWDNGKRKFYSANEIIPEWERVREDLENTDKKSMLDLVDPSKGKNWKGKIERTNTRLGFGRPTAIFPYNNSFYIDVRTR